MQSLDNLITLFRQKGLKITPQRRAILELLGGDDSHPAVDDIYQCILNTMPDISRTTVYNVLRELVALGAITEVHDLSAGGLRYDTNTGNHHHLYCTRCHALIDIDRDFAGLEISPEEAGGFQVIRHQVTFYGICPICQSTPRKE